MAEIIARQLIYDGWYRFSRLELRMPDGTVAERHLIDNGQAVAVLPFDRARRVAMLITQPRAAVLDAGLRPCWRRLRAGSMGPARRSAFMRRRWRRAAFAFPRSNRWPISGPFRRFRPSG